jgi:hypothetical protein
MFAKLGEREIGPLGTAGKEGDKNDVDVPEIFD